MPTCAVSCCKNRQDSKPKTYGVSYFRFPTDAQKRKTWISCLKRGNWQPGKNDRICSVHFVDGCHSDDPGDVNYRPTEALTLYSMLNDSGVGKGSDIPSNFVWEQMFQRIIGMIASAEDVLIPGDQQRGQSESDMHRGIPLEDDKCLHYHPVQGLVVQDN